MIPIRDLNPTRSPAVVVPLLVAANAFVFLFVQPTFAGGTPQSRALEQARFSACNALIPYEVTHGELVSEAFAPEGQVSSQRELIAVLQRGTARTGPGCPEKNVWFSMLQSMFLHGGWLHIIFNMLFLWVFGNNVEDRLGRARFLAFYLLCGVAAALAQTYTTPDSAVPMVGASGAIAGVLGAYLLMFPRARVVSLLIVFVFITTIELPAIVVLAIWFLLQLTPLLQEAGTVTGDVGGVAYMAHVGGFIAGMALLFLFRPRRPAPAPPYPYYD